MSILILCTGNSCRSILAEAMFNELGDGQFMAYSAGSQPAGAVNPDALAKLRAAGHATDGLRSKSWDEFSGNQAPDLDIVITVCDNASRESCPVWSGVPVNAHWGLPDPADAAPAESAAAFELTYQQLRARIEQVLQVPFRSMETRFWKEALQRIHDAARVSEKA